MRRNNGFSIVEGVVIVAIVAVIGALGWVFYNNFVAGDGSTSTSDSAVTTDKSMPAVETSSDLQKAEEAINAINIDTSVDTSAIDAALQ